MGFPPAWPVDGRDGGVPDPATAGPQMIQIGTEGGFLPAPVVLPNQPVNYEYDRRNIVVLNVKEKTLFLGPAERADVIIDFSGIAPGSKVLLYNDSPAPVPAGDPRVDYYTGNPDYTANGGAQPTLPGYGPNTRTIMQFRVEGTPGTTFDLAALNAAWPAAYVASQDPPIVPQTAYPAPWNAATDTYARIQDYSITFKPVGSSSPKTIYFKSKAIQELFDPYGRMNATLGVELPFTTILNQTTLPFGYLDPPTEILRFGETQIWKITHNGVDTHPVHVHLFNVQVINRVGWDGAIRPPDPNELGWKETVRMNPLEDIIVALKPVRPKLPFGVPNSIRPLDPSSPLGTTGQFAAFDPLGQPVTTFNTLYNFGWEYVWHCHILGHEENDFMRAMVVTGSVPIGALELLLLD
jgi:FtsP/CotA-like multicopper oxidase with cupredoxin domain